jgi:hypothetical protein
MIQNAGYSASFCSCRTRFSRQKSSPFVAVDPRQHGKGAVGILRQATIPNLDKTPQALRGKEGMLNLRSDAGLAPIGFLVGIRQGAVSVGSFVGEVLRLRRNRLESRTLFLVPISAVTIKASLFAMEQMWHLVAVMHVGRREAGAMNQAGLTVRPDVQLHVEVPLVAFPGLVHLRVAALLLIFGRGRCGDQRRIDNRAARQLHAISQQQLANFGEQGRAQVMLLPSR